jgi:hypothetical protein
VQSLEQNCETLAVDERRFFRVVKPIQNFLDE